MPDVDLDDPPTDPEAFARWRDAARRDLASEKAQIELEKAKLADRPLSRPQSLVVPVLLAILFAITGYQALGMRSSIERIDRRTLKIENAFGAIPTAETPAKNPSSAEKVAPPENRSAESKNLADTLNAIKEQVAATRVKVDAIRGSIADLQKFASTAKDPAPAGFASDEMLVAQKGLIVKSTAPGGAASGGARTWLATPSHDMLDLLLKIPPRESSQILTFVSKQKNRVTSIDVYDRDSKGSPGRIADCQTEDKRLRCKLKVAGPTVLQVIAKTQGDEPLEIELEPAS